MLDIILYIILGYAGVILSLVAYARYEDNKFYQDVKANRLEYKLNKMKEYK